MGSITVSGTVIARDSIGQFRSDLLKAGDETIQDAVRQGAELSKVLAPKRTGALAGSITYQANGHSGNWSANVPYALIQELGASRHPITGWVSFFWENAGRDWKGGPNIIDHPGNPATHYLLNSYSQIMSRVMAIARKYYPN